MESAAGVSGGVSTWDATSTTPLPNSANGYYTSLMGLLEGTKDYALEIDCITGNLVARDPNAVQCVNVMVYLNELSKIFSGSGLKRGLVNLTGHLACLELSKDQCLGALGAIDIDISTKDENCEDLTGRMYLLIFKLIDLNPSVSDCYFALSLVSSWGDRSICTSQLEGICKKCVLALVRQIIQQLDSVPDSDVCQRLDFLKRAALLPRTYPYLFDDEGLLEGFFSIARRFSKSSPDVLQCYEALESLRLLEWQFQDREADLQECTILLIERVTKLDPSERVIHSALLSILFLFQNGTGDSLKAEQKTFLQESALYLISRLDNVTIRSPSTFSGLFKDLERKGCFNDLEEDQLRSLLGRMSCLYDDVCSTKL